jgi:hypothetical protein
MKISQCGTHFFNYQRMNVKKKYVCESPVLKKLLRASKLSQFKILEKDVIDEIIFRTSNQRNWNLWPEAARSREVLTSPPLRSTPMPGASEGGHLDQGSLQGT